METRFDLLVTLLAAAAPALLLVAGLPSSSWMNRHAEPAARWGATAGVLALLSASAAALGIWTFGPASLGVDIGPMRFDVQLDRLSATALLLVSFLLAVVLRFSRGYMAGERDRGHFTRWLCLTGAAVLTLVVSGNLLQLALAWSATSLCLHQLLLLYPERPGARLAARKKFLISRAGDVCLAAALVLAWMEFGTWNFTTMFATPETTAVSPISHALAVILTLGAMLKSAQFPFHTWLPDTMETPTPVSALMHAGVINAGGFLVIRMSPIIERSPAAMLMLVVIGGFTAVFAACVMLTQASVKRSLAFSTVAQMGFMMFECGLGAFGLALLHLVAHSLYKAYAFLSSGSGIAAVRTASTPRPSAVASLAGATFAVATVAVGARVVGVNLTESAGSFVLAGLFTTALASLAAGVWSAPHPRTRILAGALLPAALTAGYLLLHRLFDQALPTSAGLHQPVTPMVAAGVSLCFAALLAARALPAPARQHRFVGALYVHARNGFYMNTLANRGVAAIWPLSPAVAQEFR